MSVIIAVFIVCFIKIILLFYLTRKTLIKRINKVNLIIALSRTGVNSNDKITEIYAIATNVKSEYWEKIVLTNV